MEKKKNGTKPGKADVEYKPVSGPRPESKGAKMYNVFQKFSPC